jgi:hypothetical protein
MFMHTRKTTCTMIVCGVMLGMTQWAFADDLTPPPYRGGPRSTSAEWDFLPEDGGGISNPLLPDGNTVPLVVGDFEPQLDAAFPGGAPHPSGFANGGLTYNGFGFSNNTNEPLPISFNVPNWIDQEPFKLLRLQVTYRGELPTTSVFGFLGVPGDTAAVIEIPSPPVLGTGTDPLYFYQDWELFPNPDWEQVVLTLPPGTFVDQVVIDSISIPEPSTLALLLMGAVAMTRMAHRRRTC